MSLTRSLLLAASQNRWLRDDAMQAAKALRGKQIGTVFTQLGENIKDPEEAQQVADHYLEVLSRIQQTGVRAEISVKLTQLGLDLSPALCFSHLKTIIERAPKDSIVWLDMESSNYVDATLDLYRRTLGLFPNVGVCLQAYLFRTRDDLSKLLTLRPSIRLVKGAYNESAEIAFPRKQDVDENYFALAKEM